MMRTLVDRWFLGTTPFGMEQSRFSSWVIPRLRELQRVLGVLHPAVEYPRPETTRVLTTTNTSITATSATDITDAVIVLTPDVDMKVMVWGTFSVTCGALGAVGQKFSGTLDVNGVAQSAADWGPSAASSITTVTGTWVVDLMSNVQYTLKLRGATSNVATTFTVLRDNTSITSLTIPNPYKVP